VYPPYNFISLWALPELPGYFRS